jgi:nucleotide-binding universal stress UspA family protein
MFREIVVGVDPRDEGRDAIALATKLADRDANLILTRVLIGDPLGLAEGAQLERLERERAEEVLKNLGEKASRSGVETVQQTLWSTSVGRGLHVLAETEAADLVVVGSSRRGMVGRALLGDDTRAALNGAPCAVAVAPAGYCEHPREIRRVGVGYDGSPESEHALEVARELAAEHQAKLSACTAVSVPLAALGPGPLPLSDVIDGLVHDARDRIAALDAEPHAAYGAIGEILASYSASLDLLVLGSRGYGPIGRLVHGSASNELARTARCPLLILPRATRSTATQSDAAERQQTLPEAREGSQRR